jgi:serine/threonine-protein kinase
VYPWGTVYVDGEKKGTTPLREPIPLAPGTHLITIANPDFGEINRSILIEEKQTFHLKHNFTNEE